MQEQNSCPLCACATKKMIQKPLYIQCCKISRRVVERFLNRSMLPLHSSHLIKVDGNFAGAW